MGRPALGRLGPFIGGMNTSSAPSAIGDNELVDCVNFDVDIDGSLVSRPPIVSDPVASTMTASTSRKMVIGNGIINGVCYVFVFVPGVGVYSYNGTTASLIVNAPTLVTYTCVQVADLIFFFPATSSGVTGGYWNGTTYTTDANMPRCEAAVLYKQRLWCVPGVEATTPATYNQLRFTEPINPAAPTPLVWTATNSIAINQGDGQKLVDLQVYNDNLLLFKQDSVFIYAYDVLPSDGAVKVVNTTIGASTRNCVTSHDNASYVFHEGSVYEIVNYTFTKINVKVPFILEDGKISRTDKVFLSILGDRLIVRYFDRIYVYATRTRSWSRWLSDSSGFMDFGTLVEMPKLVVDGSPVRYYAGSTVPTGNPAYNAIFTILDGYNESSTEEITGWIITKYYDYGLSASYKKLAWWGADVYASDMVTGTVSPVFLAPLSVSWSEVHTVTWDSLNTWRAPVLIDASITTEIVIDDLPQRTFLKFLKAIRFRQAFFKLEMTSDGTSLTGPSRIYSLTTVIGAKQLVPEGSN